MIIPELEDIVISGGDSYNLRADQIAAQRILDELRRVGGPCGLDEGEGGDCRLPEARANLHLNHRNALLPKERRRVFHDVFEPAGRHRDDDLAGAPGQPCDHAQLVDLVADALLGEMGAVRAMEMERLIIWATQPGQPMFALAKPL